MNLRFAPLALPAPPVAAVVPHLVEAHGRQIADDYAWLKAANWREVLKDPSALSPAIRSHLESENDYCDAVLAGTEVLRERLVAEMRGRMEEDDASVPKPDGPYAYFNRYREGGQHPLLCRTPRDGGAEEIMLDGDQEGEGRPYFKLAGAAHSPDHARLAWSADVTGSELYTIRVRDLAAKAAGADGPDAVARTTGAIAWVGDGSAFYYVEVDDQHRPVRVKRHRLGTPDRDDELVYEETELSFFIDIGVTLSKSFVTIGVSDHESSEVRLLDRADPAARPRLVAARRPQVLYDVEHRGQSLIIRTNADGAEDFKIVTAPVSQPEAENWRDLVPHHPGVMILSQVATARHLARLEREDAKPRIVVREIATGAEHAVAFAEDAFSLGMEAGLEFDTDLIRFRYSSLTTPAETYDYDMARRERILRKRQKVPSGHDPSAYVTGRLLATAPDGMKVPVSYLHRRDLALDGTAPCLLYGYGAYGISMPAGFRTNILSLVDRGFVFAIAHVRGGTEKGWRWYLDGKRENKPNTFSDFIACGEALIAGGFTGRGRIVGHGGSAGGMLMGAVANAAPDLFAAIVAEVPFVDVLNTMLDGDLPLTPPEWPEWGNPAADEAAFRTILSYSPYDNVRPQPYPPILALGGLTDPRVTYWEPAKWVAKLRATMTDGGPICLHINMGAGHGGAAGRFDRLDEVAFLYVFALCAREGFGASAA
jgi:oligopeptidase B